MKEWLTVPEAAMLVGRDKSNVWKWIRMGLLKSRTNAAGAKEVLAKDVTRVESTVRRGRPPGTARAG